MLTTEEFLREVLPEGGHKCVIAKPVAGGPLAHFWFEPHDILGMVKVIAALEAKGTFDVYHACAGYAEPGTRWAGRLAKNVSAVRSVWVDLDCGEKKDYLSQRDAGIALIGFCKATNLPIPLVINSGNGLHAYWTFAADIPLDQWRGWTNNFDALCVERGFAIDHTRTRDLASILRPVGTTNRKHDQQKPVTGNHRAPLSIRS